jgi:AraC-like DNA-binding protein
MRRPRTLPAIAPRNKALSGEKRLAVDFAALGIPEIVLLGHYDYSRAHPPLKPHIHKNIFEVCLLERGIQTYVIGATRYHLTAGDVFITKPGEIHSTGREPENKGCLYWMEFRAVETGDSFLGLPPHESQLLMRRFHSLRSHHFHVAQLLTPTFERILSAYARGQNPLRAVDVRNLLLRLVLDIIAVTERRSAHSHTPGIRNAIRHIEENPAVLPRVPQLARLAHMSESSFKIQFKMETGIPPIEYAMWHRMESAKQLLLASNLPVTRLSMDLGFSTSQQFSTVFKRLTGLTPRDFRQRAHLREPRQSPAIGAGPGFHPAENPKKVARKLLKKQG